MYDFCIFLNDYDIIIMVIIVKRNETKKVKVGNIYIGGGEKIAVQSMLNRPASDIEGSIKQAVELENAGCEIIRAAVPDMAAVKLIEKLKEYKQIMQKNLSQLFLQTKKQLTYIILSQNIPFLNCPKSKLLLLVVMK